MKMKKKILPCSNNVKKLIRGCARGVIVDGVQRSAKDERMREKMDRRNTNYIVVILLTGIGLEKW